MFPAAVTKYIFTSVSNVVREIRSWRPRECKTEAQYKHSLFRKLSGEVFRDEPIMEYGDGRTRADIAFRKNIGIELKLDLDSTAKFQRLIGQLADYRRVFDNTIVVLVGAHDRGLVKELKSRAGWATVVEK